MSALGATKPYWGVSPDYADVYILRLTVANVDFATLIQAVGPLGWKPADETICLCYQQGGTWDNNTGSCQVGISGLGADPVVQTEHLASLQHFVQYVAPLLPRGYNVYGLTVQQYSPCELVRLNRAIAHVGGHYSAFAVVDIAIRIGDVYVVRPGLGPLWIQHWRSAQQIVDDLNKPTSGWKKEFGGEVLRGEWLYIDKDSSDKAIDQWQKAPVLWDWAILPNGATTPAFEQKQCGPGTAELCGFWTGLADWRGMPGYPSRAMYPFMPGPVDPVKPGEDEPKSNAWAYWAAGIVGAAALVVAFKKKAIIRRIT